MTQLQEQTGPEETPLTLKEFAATLYYNQLAPLNYSIQGLTNLQRLEQEYAPKWAEEIKAAGVDAVFLTPG